MTQPVITVYSKPRCMPCKQTIDTLLGAGLSFLVRPITEDKAQKIRDHYGYREAPVVFVNDETLEVADHWSGFRPDKIAEVQCLTR